MPSRCIDCPHRHITFTIPSSLWPFFQKDRSLLNDLFDAASFTILSWFKGIFKMDSFIPGIVTEGAMGRITHWKSFDFFPFDMLRKRFLTKLLYNLSKKILSADFKKIKSNLYKENGKRFLCSCS